MEWLDRNCLMRPTISNTSFFVLTVFFIVTKHIIVGDVLPYSGRLLFQSLKGVYLYSEGINFLEILFSLHKKSFHCHSMIFIQQVFASSGRLSPLQTHNKTQGREMRNSCSPDAEGMPIAPLPNPLPSRSPLQSMAQFVPVPLKS